MLSPFPGMDPFLEHPAHFAGLHDGMITYLREMLQPLLPEPYYAEMSDRVWVEVSQRYLGPDVKVLRSGKSNPASEESGGVAVASPTRAEPILVRVPQDEHREMTLQIYTRLDDTERLVTSVEILSLANKTRGEQGRELYLRKQKEILDGKVNLVEIDLLRAGIHTSAVPLAHATKKAGSFDYHVCVHRFDLFEDYFVYPIQLTGRLPIVDIPLLPDDNAVSIDLQAVFDRCYDSGPYRRRVRYQENAPIPPLRPEYATWATERLRAAGLLPASSST